MVYSIENNIPNRANGELACHVLEIMSAFHESSDTGIYYKMKSVCEKPQPMETELFKGYISRSQL